ncbi:unnamed protein product [Prorocentrum cordatum]|uniref:Uncharacterized protein n=1 Tax=Prorocentrum cordatum TaxID=2364126 RepID=A0ABN9XSC5_9DINO|nr:unnamed protein product [Polarella glacialis]
MFDGVVPPAAASADAGAGSAAPGELPGRPAGSPPALASEGALAGRPLEQKGGGGRPLYECLAESEETDTDGVLQGRPGQPGAASGPPRAAEGLPGQAFGERESDTLAVPQDGQCGCRGPPRRPRGPTKQACVPSWRPSPWKRAPTSGRPR